MKILMIMLLAIMPAYGSAVGEAIEGLNYQTETDSAWTLSNYNFGRIDCQGVKKMLRRPPLSPCSEEDFAETFQHLIDTQPQQNEYINLYNCISGNWIDYSAFILWRSGTEYDLVFVGVNEFGQIEIILASGVQT